MPETTVSDNPEAPDGALIDIVAIALANGFPQETQSKALQQTASA
jgi:hypothetical protein